MTSDTSTPPCTNHYGPESGPHDGPAEWAAVLTSASTGRVLTRIEPLCYGHADYEERWSRAVGRIAQVRVERLNAG